MKILYALLFFLIGLLNLLKADTLPVIRGIYGHPKPFYDQGWKLKELGVNAVFVHGSGIDSGLVQKVREEGLFLFAEFPTLNGKTYVESHPEAWAIDENGRKVEAASWFMGVCPTEPGFRSYRLAQLHEIVQKYRPDGIFLDYVHWHAQFEEPEPILPETCFCDGCLNGFSQESGIRLNGASIPEKARYILSNHDTAWRNWRCTVLTGWIRMMRDTLKSIDPNARLGVYHCPWDDEEFKGARRRILGIDYEMWKPWVDIFSPMVYHGRMGRSTDWVKQNIGWFSQTLSLEKGNYPLLWPIVQAYDDPEKITARDFESVLLGALSGASSGVMMFTSTAVASSPEKTAAMQKIYLKLSERRP